MYRRGLQNRGKLLVFSGLAVVLFFGCLEVTCRGVEALVPEIKAPFGALAASDQGAQRFSAPMPPDRHLNWHLEPGYRGISTGVFVTHNHLGLRSPEVTCGPHPSSFRVLLLGDSTIYGHGVQEPDTVRSQLEQGLQQAHPGLEVDVVNGGVPGFSSCQSLELLSELEWCVEPNIVVIASLFCDAEIARTPDTISPLIPPETQKGNAAPANENSERFETTRERERSATGDAVRASWEHSLIHTMVAHSALARAATLFTVMLADRDTWDRMWIHAPTGDASEDDLEMATHNDGRPAVHRVPVEAYERNLKTMIRLARKRGGDAVLLLLESRAGFQASCLASEDQSRTARDGTPLRADALSKASRDPVERYRQAMYAVARAEHVTLVDMRQVLARACRQDEQDPDAWYLDEVHPTAKGHRLMAEYLAPAVLSLLSNAPAARHPTPLGER